jgi:hypothetical protein
MPGVEAARMPSSLLIRQRGMMVLDVGDGVPDGLGEAPGVSTTVSPPGAPVTAARVAETAPVPACGGVPPRSAPIPDDPPALGVGTVTVPIGGAPEVRLPSLAGGLTAVLLTSALGELAALVVLTPPDGVATLPPPPAPAPVPPVGPAPLVPPLPVVP